jgi:hypothetical protein
MIFLDDHKANICFDIFGWPTVVIAKDLFADLIVRDEREDIISKGLSPAICYQASDFYEMVAIKAT